MGLQEPTSQRSKMCVLFLLEIIYLEKKIADGLSGFAAWEASVAFLGLNSNHSNNYDNDDECFEVFFCWWSQSSDKLWARSNSSEDETMAVSEEAHTPGRGKVLRKSLLGRSWACRRGRLQTLFAKPLPGWSQPCVSQIPALHLLHRRTLVALKWPVQLLVPRGAKVDFPEVLSFDWLGFRVCITPCEQSDPRKLNWFSGGSSSKGN